MAILVTGAAGFIGVNLVKALLGRGHTVFGIDNFSNSSPDNLVTCLEHPNFTFVKTEMTSLASFGDAIDLLQTKQCIKDVWHLAANSDIPAGIADFNVDLQSTFLTTFHTLMLMEQYNISRLAFASSSAVYGDLGQMMLTEDTGPLLPISNYGAMKLSSEAVMSAAAERFLTRALIFRFPNVVGVPATHGVIRDFIQKLKVTPTQLDVLGNGTQQKLYLHVDDLIEAMLYIDEYAQDKRNVFNIGPDDAGATVEFIAKETVHRVSPGAAIMFGEGNKGWVGDVPYFNYSIEKLRQLGWHQQLSSTEAVRKAIHQIWEADQRMGV